MIKIVKILITFNLFDINKHIKDKGKITDYNDYYGLLILWDVSNNETTFLRV